MKRLALVVLVVWVSFMVIGCGDRSSIEGRVVDEKGDPVAGLKLFAKQVQPVKDYEEFTATTRSDGSFRFRKLFPASDYILLPQVEDWGKSPKWILKYDTGNIRAMFNKEGWASEKKMKVRSGPDGQTVMLDSPIVIQPFISRVEGVIVDGKKQPMNDVSVIAEQINAVPGYEKFETQTDSDGKFKFSEML